MLELKLGHFYKLNDYLQKELNVGPIVKIVAKIGSNCSIQEPNGRVFTLMTSLLADNAMFARNISNFSGTVGHRSEENVPSTIPNSDKTPEPTLPPEPEPKPVDTAPLEPSEPETNPKEDSQIPEEELAPQEDESPSPLPEDTVPEEEPIEPTQPSEPEPEDNPYGDEPYGDNYI